MNLKEYRQHLTIKELHSFLMWLSQHYTAQEIRTSIQINGRDRQFYFWIFTTNHMTPNPSFDLGDFTEHSIEFLTKQTTSQGG